MVAGYHDDGILHLPVFLQYSDGIGHKGIESLYFVVVIGHIAPYYFVIRKTIEKPDPLQFHSGTDP